MAEGPVVATVDGLRAHDEAVADDMQASMYVKMLETDFDRRAEAAMPSADDLAAEFEQFLRDHRDDD